MKHRIEDLGLSFRLSNALEARHITHLEMLGAYSEKEILWFNGVGKKVLEELLRILKEKNIRLRVPITLKTRRLRPLVRASSKSK